jgi:hypothetical protein
MQSYRIKAVSSLIHWDDPWRNKSHGLKYFFHIIAKGIFFLVLEIFAITWVELLENA